MNETNNSWLVSGTGTAILANSGYSGTTPTLGCTGTSLDSINSGMLISGNSSSFSLSTAIINSNNMNRQVKVAVFEITRDEDTNEINSTKFLKELWVERKNGTSIDLIIAKQLDKDFNPETIVIKEIYSVSF